MAKIMVLSEQTACRIAAGEVVERPVSVVKELVENSLDAGSNLINISITGGGMESIAVIDNGYGISQEDTPLAFQRHATSKIKTATDLDSITTLGFRGEALPSIAAVSDLTIKTRVTQIAEGYYMHIRGGNVLEKGSAGCPVGTNICVKELFFNTPARRKHLKAKSTEAGLINDLINKIALTRPKIKFILQHNGREVFRSPGSGDMLDVLAAIYGIQAAKQMVPVQADNLGIKISGYIGKPELSRSTRQQITLAVNGRIVRSMIINNALDEAYRGLFTVGRYPIAVLSLWLSPENLDVNIHPAKMEIKFDLEEEIRALVTRAVRDALRETKLVPSLDSATIKNKNFLPTSEPYRLELPVTQEFTEKKPDSSEENSNYESNNNQYITAKKDVYTVTENDTSTALDKTGVEQKSSTWVDNDQQLSELKASYKKNDFPALQGVGQILNAYIIAVADISVYIVDQHAAHERILFEKYINMLENAKPEIQYLIVPVNINIRQYEKEILKDYKKSFQDMGFIFEEFGRDNYLLRGIPVDFSPGESERLVADMLEVIMEQGKVNNAVMEYAMASLLACKAAVKAGERLTMEAMQALVDQLAMADEPYTCPHGRPTLVSLTKRDLDTMFKRI